MINKAAHKIIDPHLHLFNMQQGDYAWLKPSNPPFWPDKHLISKDFQQIDLSLGSSNQLHGFVHIEAGFNNQQPWLEIDWLQQHCTFPFKSVAFADITNSTFQRHIEQLKQRTSVVGIRHILDEQAVQILSANSINQHFELLAQAELSFDAQLSLNDEQTVNKLVDLATKHNKVNIIINHGGWPLENESNDEKKAWRDNLRKLALCENIAIKLSGWEMSNRNWQPQQVSIVLKDCIEVFSQSRVMLASNFPLCLFSMSYADLWRSYAELPEISPQCFEKITFSNALTWYKF